MKKIPNHEVDVLHESLYYGTHNNCRDKMIVINAIEIPTQTRVLETVNHYKYNHLNKFFVFKRYEIPFSSNLRNCFFLSQGLFLYLNDC